MNCVNNTTTYEQHFKQTPFIVTICDSTITSIDIQNLIEMGISIIKFKMTHITEQDIINLIDLINNASQKCCEKYNVDHWPIAISLDIPNCVIKSGILKKEIPNDSIVLKEQSYVEITSNDFYLDKSDDKIIFVDDPFILKSLKVNMEISIGFSKIILFCTEIVNESTIKCKVFKGGILHSAETVCVRGVVHTKPRLCHRDLKLIEFSKTVNVQMITINSVRRASTLQKVKTLLGLDHKNLLILSSICEQEGLDNVDSIIEESDAIILERDFLTNEIVHGNKIMTIQIQLAAKCRKMGKPFFISGDVFGEGLKTGEVVATDVSDVTNAILQYAGFVLKDYGDPKFLLESVGTLNKICRYVEPFCQHNGFWRLSLEFPVPVNSAQACILACALSVHKLGARAVILPTVSGHTVVQLVRLAPMAVIISISTDPLVAKKLQIYRGVVPIIYESKRKRFQREMDARIAFALEYGLKHNFLKHGQVYVTLQRSSTTSAYCDMYNAMDLPGQQFPAANSRTHLDHALNLDISKPPGCQRLTGIIATMGKSTNNIETMEKMMAAGMNIAIVNMAYGSKDDHIDTIKMLRQASKDFSEKMGKNYPLGIAIRLSGRKIRTGYISETYGTSVELKTTEIVRLTSDETYREKCSPYTIFVDFITLGTQLKKGDSILLDNESILLRVEIISATTITCKIERGGILGSYKDVFIPNVIFDMPNYTEKDKLDVEMALKQQVDFIIAPFVHYGSAITELKVILGPKGKKIRIIAQVQTLVGLNHFDEILKVAEAIMIARLELGTDITPKKLVIAQKNMIARANKANVPISISAQLLNSMCSNDLPLRAELLDISNCILDGVDALVLTAETAVGQYPVEAIACLASACKEAEACVWTRQIFQDLVEITPIACDQATATAIAGVLTAQRTLAAAIIVVTTSGQSAQIVAKYRPRCPILAVTRYFHVARHLHLWRGIMPLIYEDNPDSDWDVDLEQRVTFGVRWGMAQGFIRVADPLVIVSGWRQGSGFTNTVRVVYATNDNMSL